MQLATAIVIDGLSYAAWLFLVSVGMTLIFGVMQILNVAHGGVYSFGAYSAAFAVGVAVTAGWAAGVQFALLAATPILVGAALGYVLERAVLRPLYRHDHVLLLLATYSAFLVLEDLTKLIWGGGSLYANAPREALGYVELGDLPYPVYDLALIVLAMLIAVSGARALNATRLGRLVTAVVADREMSAAMGIDVRRIFAGTFVVGSVLGCVAGALTAPKIAVLPGIGVEVIVLAFAVVVIGGLGSFGGAIVGALVVGIARALTSHLLPAAELFVIYGVMALVLAFRPYGLFVAPEARKI